MTLDVNPGGPTAIGGAVTEAAPQGERHKSAERRLSTSLLVRGEASLSTGWRPVFRRG